MAVHEMARQHEVYKRKRIQARNATNRSIMMTHTSTLGSYYWLPTRWPCNDTGWECAGTPVHVTQARVMQVEDIVARFQDKRKLVIPWFKRKHEAHHAQNYVYTCLCTVSSSTAKYQSASCHVSRYCSKETARVWWNVHLCLKQLKCQHISNQLCMANKQVNYGCSLIHA